MATDYSKLKNAELETLLKERNLPHQGKKAEMVARLQDHDKSATSAAPELSEPATSEPAAVAVAAGGQVRAPNPQAVPNQAVAVDPATTDDLAVKENTETSTPAPPPESFASNLPATSLDDEMAKRKARALKFGIKEDNDEAGKAKARAERFGTGTSGVSARLDAALPEARGKKRGSDAGTDEYEDSGLKRRRGGGASRGRGPRREGGGESAKVGGASAGAAAWMSEKDRTAAEARKAKWATEPSEA